MSSANVDLVRSILADWERGDFSSTEWAHPEIERVRTGGISPGRSTGITGMAGHWRDWLDAWKDFRAEADEYRELDDERVLVMAHFSGRARTSGIELAEVRTEGAALFHIREGRVTKFVTYVDRKHALADLGLEE